MHSSEAAPQSFSSLVLLYLTCTTALSTTWGGVGPSQVGMQCRISTHGNQVFSLLQTPPNSHDVGAGVIGEWHGGNTCRILQIRANTSAQSYRYFNHFFPVLSACYLVGNTKIYPPEPCRLILQTLTDLKTPQIHMDASL